jgi:hypothetical protein
MNVGKLYQAKNYYWMLYPSKDVAAHAANTALSDGRIPSAHASPVERAAAYYSKRFKCNASYISPNSVFVLLEQDGEFIKILSANGEVGWIYRSLSDWWKDDIEGVNQ